MNSNVKTHHDDAVMYCCVITLACTTYSSCSTVYWTPLSHFAIAHCTAVLCSEIAHCERCHDIVITFEVFIYCTIIIILLST